MSRLSRNILYGIASQLLVLGLSFVSVHYVFHRLGDDAFGLIYFNQLLASVLVAALQLGVTATVVREVAAHAPTSAYVRDLVRTASTLYWTLFVVAACGVIAAAPMLVRDWVHLRSIDPATAIVVLRVLGVTSLLLLPRLLYSSLIVGIQRIEFSSVIDFVVPSGQQLGTALILIGHGTLMMVVLWNAACYVVAVAAYAGVVAHFFSFSALVPGYSASVVRRNIMFTSKTLATSLLSLVHTQADKIIVSRIMPIATVGLYGFASGVAGRAAFITNAVAQASFPAFSAEHGAGRPDMLRKRYHKVQDLLTLGLLPVFAVTPFAAGPLVTILFDSEAASVLLLPLLFLSLGYYLNGTLNPPYAVSMAAGRPGLAARTNALGLVAVIPVTVALVAFYGLAGAAFSWVFYHLVIAVLLVPPVYRDCLQLPAWQWFSQNSRAAVAGALTYGPAWYLATRGPFASGGPLALSVSYLTATTIFAVIAYRMAGPDFRAALSRVRGAHGQSLERSTPSDTIR